MTRNYDNYGYDKEYSTKVNLVRRILSVVMVIVAILLIIYLLKGCTPTRKKVKITPSVNNNTNSTINYDSYSYRNGLVEACEKYFYIHEEELPSSCSECTTIKLRDLMDENLIDKDIYGNCNVDTTYVRVCFLENGVINYAPTLTCIGGNK